jgi:DNA polymerase-3 subunit delta
VKLAAAKVAGFLKSPGPDAAAVLIYGNDRGLVRERVETLAHGVVDDLGDPFRVTELKSGDVRGDPARLADEVAAQSMIGGRRLVLLRIDGTDISKPLAAVLEDFIGDTMLIVEAGELGPRAPVRKLFEADKDAVAIACYADDERAIESLIETVLGGHGISADPDAKNHLIKQLGSDHMVSRRELEKLALYAGEKTSVSLEDVVQIVGDNGALSLEEIAYATAGGDGDQLERLLARAFRESQSPVGILRAVLRHFQKLHVSAGLMGQGKSAEQAMKQLRPPILFLFAGRFRRQLGLWSLGRARSAMALLGEAERDCKSTGLPDEAVCHRALIRLAMAARAH